VLTPKCSLRPRIIEALRATKLAALEVACGDYHTVSKCISWPPLVYELSRGFTRDWHTRVMEFVWLLVWSVSDITAGVWTWGSNTNGQLGVGRYASDNIVTATSFAKPPSIRIEEVRSEVAHMKKTPQTRRGTGIHFSATHRPVVWYDWLSCVPCICHAVHVTLSIDCSMFSGALVQND